MRKKHICANYRVTHWHDKLSIIGPFFKKTLYKTTRMYKMINPKFMPAAILLLKGSRVGKRVGQRKYSTVENTKVKLSKSSREERGGLFIRLLLLHKRATPISLQYIKCTFALFDGLRSDSLPPCA